MFIVSFSGTFVNREDTSKLTIKRLLFCDNNSGTKSADFNKVKLFVVRGDKMGTKNFAKG